MTRLEEWCRSHSAERSHEETALIAAVDGDKRRGQVPQVSHAERTIGAGLL